MQIQYPVILACSSCGKEMNSEEEHIQPDFRTGKYYCIPCWNTVTLINIFNKMKDDRKE